jgi:hypothetical protein
MIAHYEKSGIRFAYPENWSIVDEQLDEWPQGVSVQSPKGGYWDLKVFPAGIDPNRISDEALDAMRQEYADLESEPITEEIFGVTAVGYNLDFFCMDLLVTSRIRSFDVGTRTLLLICQAESREFDRQRLVYDAITKSLLDD